MDSASQSRQIRSEPAAAFPALFVLLWSTGFIAAKYGLPDAPPLKFLFVRFVLVALLMTAVAAATRSAWPRSFVQFGHLAVAAWMVHGLYLGGVFIAISGGMPAGTIAMLVGLQPIVTVWIARLWFGERVTLRQWSGLVLGLIGVWLVVRHKVDFSGNFAGLLPASIAVAGISVGTLYQKRYCSGIDLRSGSAVQFGACALVLGPLAFWLEDESIRWTLQFSLALGWSVLVLSIGAISLLFWLLRHGASANVARLFYLVPPVTAAMAYALFGETLDRAAVAGMALIAFGVALARQASQPAATAAAN